MGTSCIFHGRDFFVVLIVNKLDAHFMCITRAILEHGLAVWEPGSLLFTWIKIVTVLHAGSIYHFINFMTVRHCCG